MYKQNKDGFIKAIWYGFITPRTTKVKKTSLQDHKL